MAAQQKQRVGIFLDIDGTLTNNQKLISSYDQKILGYINQHTDHQIYLITGKSAYNALKYYQILQLKTKLVTSAGQVISNPFLNQTYYAQFTKWNHIKRVLKFLKTQELLANYLIETQNHQYFMSQVEVSNLSRLIAGNDLLLPLKKHVKVKHIIGTYLQLKNINTTELAALTKKLKLKFKKLEFNFWFTAGNPHILQIKPQHTCKAKAMQKIIKWDDLDYTIAFGNGQTDMTMLAQSDCGVAMVNAFAPVKAVANSVSKADNNHSGVGKTLQEILDLKVQ